MKGIKHLLQCHCVLPQYRNKKEPIFHCFVAFSLLDDGDVPLPKIVQCSNCGILHKVIDVCKSEILVGKEDLRSAMTITDLSRGLSPDLVELLKSHEKQLADFEHAKFIIDNELWGEKIVLDKEEIEGLVQGKTVTFVSATKFRVEPFSENSNIE